MEAEHLCMSLRVRAAGSRTVTSSSTACCAATSDHEPSSSR